MRNKQGKERVQRERTDEEEDIDVFIIIPSVQDHMQSERTNEQEDIDVLLRESYPSTNVEIQPAVQDHIQSETTNKEEDLDVFIIIPSIQEDIQSETTNEQEVVDGFIVIASVQEHIQSERINKQEDLDILLPENHPSTNVEVQPSVQEHIQSQEDLDVLLRENLDVLLRENHPSTNVEVQPSVQEHIQSEKTNKQEDLDVLLRENHPSTNVEIHPAVQLEPYTWKEIRLFLSSSFIDTHAEMDALIKRVIPNLNRQLADRFIYIVPVDLRWGVLEEESKDCYAIQKTCLNQIDRCRQDVDEYPWFLGLRTDRYGWVQDKLLESAEYSNPRKYDWVKTLEEYKKELSVTSLECIHAALPPNKMRPAPTVLFYKRHISNPENVEENLKWVFEFEFVPEETKLAAEVQNHYTRTNNAVTYQEDKENLDKYLKSLEHIKYSTYRCRYEKNRAWITGNNWKKKFGAGYVSGLEDFEKVVEKDLLDAIDKNFKDADISALPAYVLKNIPHENAVKDRASTFVGRSKLYEEIYQHCKSEDVDNSVLIIHGDPGCGTSALLTKVSTTCLNDLRENGEFVFTHAVDSCPGSGNLEIMLRRLHVNLQNYRIELGETNLSEQCPKSNNDLKSEHVNSLEESARQHPERLFVIVIDSVNNFHDSIQSWKMWWLPVNSPNNVRFVISTSNEENGTFENACKMCPNAIKIPVDEMSYEDGEEMVSTILEKYNKKLTTTDDDAFLGNQLKSLLNKNLSPLYLTAATQALRRFGIYENVRDYINNLPDTIHALFNFLIDSWSEEYGARFIRDVTCIICLSKDGLLENEMNDILSFIEQEKRVDYQCSFSRVCDSLCGFLAAGGGGYLRFFHDQLNKVVRNKFLNPTFEREIHGWLVEFYLHNIRPQLIEQQSVEPPSYYPHCLEQVVYHQLKSMGSNGKKEDFMDTLRNIYFVRERVILQQENLLQREYIQAVRQTMDENNKKTLNEWGNFAQLYSLHIEKFPEWSFNMAINQPPTSHVAIDTNTHPEPATSDGYPLYWTNVPSADDAMTVVLKYTSMRCWSCVASASERNLICIGGKKEAFLYEMDSGVLLHQVKMHGWINSVYLATNYSNLWTGDSEGYVTIWSVDTGGKEWTSEKIGTQVIWIDIVGDYVACGTGGKYVSGTISFFDEPNRNMVKSWPTESYCSSYCYQGNKNMILSSHGVRHVIKCWSVEGELMRSVQVAEGGEVSDFLSLRVHPTADDVIAFVLEYEYEEEGSKYCVKQMDLSTGEVICTIPDISEYGGVSYDNSGERLLCVNKDNKTIMVYGEDGELQNKLKGYSSWVYNMCLVPGKNALLTAGSDGIMLIDLPTTPDQDVRVEGTEEVIKCCEFLHSGGEFVTLSTKGKLQKWVTSTCERSTSVHIEGWDERHGGALVHPGGNYIVAYTDKNLYCINSVNLEKVSSYNVVRGDEDDWITDVKISQDGMKYVVARHKGTAVVYDIGNINKRTSYDMSYGMCDRVGEKRIIKTMFSGDIHHDNERVVSAGERGVEVWSLSTGQQICKLRDKQQQQRRVSHRRSKSQDTLYVQLLHSSDRILYVDGDYHVSIMDMKGVHLITFDSTLHKSLPLKLIRNGTQLITGERDNSIRFHDLHTGKVLYTFVDQRSEGFTCFLEFSSNKKVHAYNSNGMLYVLKNSRN